MKVTQGITWVGSCTAKFDEMVTFFNDVMGLEVDRTGVPVVDTQYARYAVFKTPGDVMFELFEPKDDIRDRFSGPVVSFTVENLDEARAELEAESIELLTPVLDDGTTWRWCYFRAPDGNVYLLQERYED